MEIQMALSHVCVNVHHIFFNTLCTIFYKNVTKIGPHSSFPKRLAIACSFFSASLSTILTPTFIFSHIPIIQLQAAVHTDVT